MAEVIEQINKMTREEKIRLAHLLLDAIEHGAVIKPSAPVRKSAFGALAKYADGKKRKFEKFAWSLAAAEKEIRRRKHEFAS